MTLSPANAPFRSTTCSHSKPCVFERLGLRGRVGVVDGRLVHVAELQANALAVLEVDGGEQDHRLPPQEIRDQGQAERLALFRMELRSGNIVARDGGGDRAAIVGGGQHIVAGLAASR